jgi:alkanesulfonate monooxygenase SsuD/methylene tetrahydromethanopterin reductase-like flavin-dependent oxidoreductase (luciferase family)
VKSKGRVSFGYNTPAGERGVEHIEAATFVRDLEAVCDIASQHFDAFWVPDHFMRGDTFRLECWTQLTWLAARYPSQFVGTVVMANSYRHPPLLAKMAASLQEFSRGRLILGYGAGWLQDEYEAYGYPFPPAKTRIAEMVEGIQAIRILWTQSPATFEGSYLHVRDAYCHPQPDPIPPIMIGGDGERYLLRAVAEHGDWWLPFSHDLVTLRHKIDVLEQHCQEVGRDSETIVKVYPLTVYLASTKSAAEGRAGAALVRDEGAFVGEPEALRDHLMELVDLGFSHFVLAFGEFPGVDDIRLFADRVLPAFS